MESKKSQGRLINTRGPARVKRNSLPATTLINGVGNAVTIWAKNQLGKLDSVKCSCKLVC